MNWFSFTNAPTWFWLHASKPTTNAESDGYGLSFWRPYNDTNFSPTHFPTLPAGHFTPIDDNFNAVAGFARYLPWDSVRVNVTEAGGPHPDYRTLAYLFNPAAALWRHGLAGVARVVVPRARRDAAARAAATHLGVVLTNRGNATGFTFAVALLGVPQGGAPPPVFAGFAYGPTQHDVPLGNFTAAMDAYGHWALQLTLPPLTIGFFVQQ